MSNPAITTRFMILGTARSGSTALTATLNTHPDVYCHGHPFFQNHKNRSALRREAAEIVDFDTRDSDPVGFVRSILDFSPGPPVVGFKIWRGPNHRGLDAIKALGADTSIKKIILNRENILACQYSEDLVNLKRKDPAAFETGGRHTQLDFDAAALEKFADYRTRIFAHYRALSMPDALEVPYVGIMNSGISKIAQFLGLSDFQFHARTQKRNTYDIISRYKPEFHDEIRRCLDRIGHPEWAREG